MPEKAIVISHRKDADGISSAALVRYMSGAKVYLTDYGDVEETLAGVGKADHYYICDLGTNENTFPGFLEQLGRLSKIGSVHYTDHHPIKEEFASKIRELGVELNHSTEESAAILVYRAFEPAFSNTPEMKIIACCGAITDYLDTRPFARKLISSFDRQFLLYEATVLSFTIAIIGRGTRESNEKLVKLAQELSRGKLPHEIKGASTLAQAHVKRSAALVKLAKRKGKKMNNFAYILTKESSTGNVANFLIGAFDVPVGVAFRQEQPEYYEISLRSIDESNKDLGKIASRITSKIGGSGGGHPHASGARIPKSNFGRFLSLLDEQLSVN